MPDRRLGRVATRLAAVALLVAIALSVGVSSAVAAPRRVPFGFFAVNWEVGAPPDLDSASLSGQRAQARLMVRSGVESVRIPFKWANAQPYATAAQVPPHLARHFVRGPGGVPTDFRRTDRYVRIAAERGLKLLPFVLFAPRWASDEPSHRYYMVKPSRDPTPYTNYLLALIGRYGPSGSFWRSNPRVPKRPLREWQIWHEPNVGSFWQEQPFAERYVSLLRAAYGVIHSADPGARVVLAGLPNRSWEVLDRLYRAGAGGYFDAAAVHPFTLHVSGLVRLIELFRTVMNRNGEARKPMYLTEVAWTTAKGRIPTSMLVGIEVSAHRQNANLRTAYRKIGKRWRRLGVRRVYWERWSSVYERGFSWFYGGLVRSFWRRPQSQQGARFRPTRLLRTYASTARRLEGCRKASVATRCARNKRGRG